MKALGGVQPLWEPAMPAMGCGDLDIAAEAAPTKKTPAF
jgi:hypothetical protein